LEEKVMMSLRHAILGFLSYAPEPMSGYDLKKAFDNSVRHFWLANQSQIYRTLADLAKEELVKLEVIERTERLDVKLYEITEAGLSELRRWLSRPLPAQDYREPALIQVFFGGNIDDDALLGVLRSIQRDSRERMALYADFYSLSLEGLEQADDRRAYYLSLLTLEYGIRSERSVLEWLQSAIGRIEVGDYSQADLATLMGEFDEHNA
jgi:DNA-binding PadR family transcriptional regulator